MLVHLYPTLQAVRTPFLYRMPKEGTMNKFIIVCAMLVVTTLAFASDPETAALTRAKAAADEAWKALDEIPRITANASAETALATAREVLTLKSAIDAGLRAERAAGFTKMVHALITELEIALGVKVPDLTLLDTDNEVARWRMQIHGRPIKFAVHWQHRGFERELSWSLPAKAPVSATEKELFELYGKIDSMELSAGVEDWIQANLRPASGYVGFVNYDGFKTVGGPKVRAEPLVPYVKSELEKVASDFEAPNMEK